MNDGCGKDHQKWVWIGRKMKTRSLFLCFQVTHLTPWYVSTYTQGISPCGISMYEAPGFVTSVSHFFRASTSTQQNARKCWACACHEVRQQDRTNLITPLCQAPQDCIKCIFTTRSKLKLKSNKKSKLHIVNGQIATLKFKILPTAVGRSLIQTSNDKPWQWWCCKAVHPSITKGRATSGKHQNHFGYIALTQQQQRGNQQWGTIVSKGVYEYDSSMDWPTCDDYTGTPTTFLSLTWQDWRWGSWRQRGRHPVDFLQ